MAVMTDQNDARDVLAYWLNEGGPVTGSDREDFYNAARRLLAAYDALLAEAERATPSEGTAAPLSDDSTRLLQQSAEIVKREIDAQVDYMWAMYFNEAAKVHEDCHFTAPRRPPTRGKPKT